MHGAQQHKTRGSEKKARYYEDRKNLNAPLSNNANILTVKLYLPCSGNMDLLMQNTPKLIISLNNSDECNMGRSKAKRTKPKYRWLESVSIEMYEA